MEEIMHKLIIPMFLTIFLVISSLAIVPIARASPTITAFFEDLAGFNTAAGSPPIVVNFDCIVANTDITGSAIGGITFNLGNQPAPSAQLIVVKGQDTYTPAGFDWSGPDNKLFATSGENVLSPGGIELAPGPDPLKENDDLELAFSSPVMAVGFDILYQSLDGWSYTAITLLDASSSMLYSNTHIPIPGGAYAPGGTTFVGFVSDLNNIAKIVIDEFDDNNINPDCNIGFDTVRVRVLPLPPALSVSINPLGASIVLGQSVTFTSTIDGGTTPYSYQWYLDGSIVPSATLNTWTFTPSTAGIYYVYLKVTDAGNSTAQSQTARVEVIAPVPVGGYSVSIGAKTTGKPLTINFALAICLALFLTVIRRKERRRRN